MGLMSLVWHGSYVTSLPWFLQRVSIDCRVTFNTKISENSPSFWGFAPDPVVRCVYFFRKKYTYRYCTLNLIVLIVFRQFLLPRTKTRSIFAPPTEKSFPRLWWETKRPKNVGLYLYSLLGYSWATRSSNLKMLSDVSWVVLSLNVAPFSRNKPTRTPRTRCISTDRQPPVTPLWSEEFQ